MRRSAADHPPRLLPDRLHLPASLVDRNYRRLKQHHPFAAPKNDRVRGPQINRKLPRRQAATGPHAHTNFRRPPSTRKTLPTGPRRALARSSDGRCSQAVGIARARSSSRSCPWPSDEESSAGATQTASDSQTGVRPAAKRSFLLATGAAKTGRSEKNKRALETQPAAACRASRRPCGAQGGVGHYGQNARQASTGYTRRPAWSKTPIPPGQRPKRRVQAGR